MGLIVLLLLQNKALNLDIKLIGQILNVLSRNIERMSQTLIFTCDRFDTRIVVSLVSFVFLNQLGVLDIQRTDFCLKIGNLLLRFVIEFAILFLKPQFSFRNRLVWKLKAFQFTFGCRMRLAR